MANNFIKQLTEDIRIDLHDEFDRNFTRKAFFGKKWRETIYPNSRGSLMNRTGKLRRGLKSRATGNQIKFSNAMPYASAHNKGYKGRVKQQVKAHTRKPRKGYKGKGRIEVSAHSRVINQDIPQRQFVGHDKQVDLIIKKNIDENMKELNNELSNTLKKHFK